MGVSQKNYDDDQLVLDIAQGQMTYAQLGEKHGLAEVTIGQIARGERRPELQPKIQAVMQGLIDHARRLGARLAQVAMGRLGAIVNPPTEGKDGIAIKIDADTQRKAAVDVLKFAMGDPSRPQVNVNQNQANTQAMPGLTGEDLENLAKMKGGPGSATAGKGQDAKDAAD